MCHTLSHLIKENINQNNKQKLLKKKKRSQKTTQLQVTPIQLPYTLNPNTPHPYFWAKESKKINTKLNKNKNRNKLIKIKINGKNKKRKRSTVETMLN